MSVVVPHRVIDSIAEAVDPKQAILDAVGDLSGVHLLGDDVLIGIYIRPKKTAGGIIRPDMNVQEDMWQGKVGLVLKLGPNAFVDAEDGHLYEDRAKVGDWVMFFVGDARSVSIRGCPCRLIRDVNIRSTVDDPSIIF